MSASTSGVPAFLIESLIPYIFNVMHGANRSPFGIIGRVLSIECKMVAIISTASQVQAKNGANPIVRHQDHKSRGHSESFFFLT